ncbi:MAG TPA: hypothetical protein VJ550_13250 [Geomonas sp.]|nr:hypothetical protein [Geomonas sp.]
MGSYYYTSHDQHGARPEKESYLLLLASSLVLHLVLILLLPLRPSLPSAAEMAVEVGAVLPASGVPAAGVAASPVFRPPASLMRQQPSAPRPAAGAPRPFPPAGELPAGNPAAVGPAPGQGGRPAPVPFPDQQRRVDTAAPYASFSSSRRS